MCLVLGMSNCSKKKKKTSYFLIYPYGMALRIKCNQTIVGNISFHCYYFSLSIFFYPFCPINGLLLLVAYQFYALFGSSQIHNPFLTFFTDIIAIFNNVDTWHPKFYGKGFSCNLLPYILYSF